MSNGEEKAVGEAVESLEVMKLKSERALQTFEGPFSSAAAYRHYLQIAETFAASIFVPEAFRGKPGNCLIAFNLAKSMNEDPLRVMQSVYVVGGRPAFYTEFMVARTNRLAGFQSHIRWEVEKLEPAELNAGKFKMPNLRVTAWATDEFGHRIEEAVTSQMAIDDGWTKNEKYRSLPERMLKWRSASALIRMYCPDVMYGMTTYEEAITMEPGSYQVVGQPVTVASLAAGVGQGAPTLTNGSEEPALNFGTLGAGPALAPAEEAQSEPEEAQSEGLEPVGVEPEQYLDREAVAKIKLTARRIWGKVNPKVKVDEALTQMLEEMGIGGLEYIPCNRYDEVMREIGPEG